MNKVNIRKNWHSLWISMYEQMLEGCLDESKRWEIYRKMNARRLKLANMTPAGSRS